MNVIYEWTHNLITIKEALVCGRLSKSVSNDYKYLLMVLFISCSWGIEFQTDIAQDYRM
jgi:hypothetical protein